MLVFALLVWPQPPHKQKKTATDAVTMTMILPVLLGQQVSFAPVLVTAVSFGHVPVSDGATLPILQQARS